MEDLGENGHKSVKVDFFFVFFFVVKFEVVEKLENLKSVSEYFWEYSALLFGEEIYTWLEAMCSQWFVVFLVFLINNKEYEKDFLCYFY